MRSHPTVILLQVFCIAVTLSVNLLHILFTRQNDAWLYFFSLTGMVLFLIFTDFLNRRFGGGREALTLSRRAWWVIRRYILPACVIVLLSLAFYIWTLGVMPITILVLATLLIFIGCRPQKS